MNRGDVLDATREALTAAEAQAAHFSRLRARLAPGLPLAVAAERPDAEVEALNAFLRFFEQLYDVISRRLFRGAIALLDEDPVALSAKALALRLEKLGAIESRESWQRLGEMRNALVHDYAVTDEIFASHVNAAEANADLLLATLTRIGAFLKAEGLFE